MKLKEKCFKDFNTFKILVSTFEQSYSDQKVTEPLRILSTYFYLLSIFVIYVSFSLLSGLNIKSS